VTVSISVAQLGRLRRRDPREVWSHEALDFTPWLQEHIEQLNEAIGFEIELTGREEKVGPFAVDLYGTEVQTGHPAIVENQLEPTDHTHLGQLITYAAGLKAGVIVWITPKFRDEHRAALNWLNEISPQDVNFFGVELELLEINDQRAPNFKLAVQPNNWLGSRALTAAGGAAGVASERQLACQAYFAKLLEGLKARSPGITAASRTQPQNWFGFASGKAGMSFNWVFSRDRLRVELYIDSGDQARNLAIFDYLLADRESIEQELDMKLEWDRLENRRAKRIALYSPTPAPLTGEPGTLAPQQEWAVSTMLKVVQAFRPRLKAMPETAEPSDTDANG